MTDVEKRLEKTLSILDHFPMTRYLWRCKRCDAGLTGMDRLIPGPGFRCSCGETTQTHEFPKELTEQGRAIEHAKECVRSSADLETANADLTEKLHKALDLLGGKEAEVEDLEERLRSAEDCLRCERLMYEHQLTDKDALIGELRALVMDVRKHGTCTEWEKWHPKADAVICRPPSGAGEKLRRLEQQVSLLFDEFFEPCGGHDVRCLACHAIGPRYMIEHGEDCHIGHIQDLAALKSGEEGT